MASITWTDVTSFATELSSVSSDARLMILAHVNTALEVGFFGGEDGPKLRLARIFLAAHFGKLSSQGGTSIAGPVVSESAGGLSRSYANLTSTTSGSSMGTPYGDMFLELVRTSPARLPIAI